MPDLRGNPFGTRPEHHILVQPGHHPYLVDGTGRMEYVKTIWYATSRAQPTYLLNGEPIRLVVGRVFLTYRSYKVPRALHSAIGGDHALVKYGRLRIVVPWPNSRIQGRPARLVMHSEDAPTGFVTQQNEIKPFITLAPQRATCFADEWQQIMALHEGCKAGYWFRYGGKLYFTDERDAVFARLLLSA